MSNKGDIVQYKNLILNFLLTITLIGCSFISLDSQARDVIVSTDKTSLSKCKFLGKTTVSLWSKATTFQSDETVVTQLDTLARNQAASMDGNVVAADSEISNGQRTYRVYKCSYHTVDNN